MPVVISLCNPARAVQRQTARQRGSISPQILGLQFPTDRTNKKLPHQTMTQQPLQGPTRCFIKCSRRRIDQKGDTALMLEKVKFASGDAEKAFLLTSSKHQRREFIGFDYDNPKHERCKVRGFLIKKSHPRDFAFTSGDYRSCSQDG